MFNAAGSNLTLFLLVGCIGWDGMGWNERWYGPGLDGPGRAGLRGAELGSAWLGWAVVQVFQCCVDVFN
jgi:hypothetical protein